MLNERTTKKFTEMLEGMANAAEAAEAASGRQKTPAATNTFAGSNNVNIICQTLVIGSLKDLVDAANRQPN